MGWVVVSCIDFFKFVVKGKGLEEVEVGREINFIVIIKDFKGK